MPYIKKELRDCFRNMFNELININSPGELNYLFTCIILEYMSAGSAGAEQNYQAINDVLGALEGAKLEFHRRIVVPYEEKKLEENGDVF